MNLDIPEYFVDDLVEYKYWLNVAFQGVRKDDMTKGLHHRNCFMGLMRIPGARQMFLPYWGIPMHEANVAVIREIYKGTTVKDMAIDLNLTKKAIIKRMEVIHKDLRIMRFQKSLGLEAWTQIQAERRGRMVWELEKYEGLLPKDEVDHTYLEISKVIERMNRNINKSFGRSNT